MAYSKPHLAVQSSHSGKIDVVTGDGRSYELIRISDGMPLQTFCGGAAALTAAMARATAMVSAGEV